MDTTEKILIMLFNLSAKDAFPKRKDLVRRYLSFYNDEIDTATFDNCVSLLLKEKLVEIDNDCLIPTEAGHQAGGRAHVRYYFTEGIKASEKSYADRRYKDQSNGIVKCDSMIDVEQLDFIVTALAHCRGPICDLGCGTGELTAYIQENVHAKVIGLDSSAEMISIARDAHPHMSWKVGEIEAYNDDAEMGAFVLIDSIYFVKEKEAVLRRLYERLPCGGKIVLTYSAYSTEKHEIEQLAPHKNIIGKFLESFSITADFEEFTRNEIALWTSRLKLLEILKFQYTEEHNEYLYYDKKNEGDGLLKKLVQGLGRRHIYVIQKTCT